MRRLPRLDSGGVVLLVLAFILAACLAKYPAQINAFLLPAIPVMRLWADPAEQYRRNSFPAPYDLLQVADATLPRQASVLLVTSGQDVKRTEYITYHRALYFLTPRHVWWLSAAHEDGTWESRKWISAALTTQSIRAVAAEAGAGYLLTYGLDNPLEIGRLVYSNAGGQLIQLNTSSAPLEPQQPRAAAAGRLWPLQLTAAVAVVLGLGFSLLHWIDRSRPPGPAVERLSLSWILGAGVVSLGMFWLSLLGLRLAAQMALLTLVSLPGLFLCCRWLLNSKRAGPKQPRRHPLFRSPLIVLLYLVLALQVMFVALLAVGRPLAIWDSWASWGFKARTIFLEGGILPAVYAGAARASTLPQYPLMFPSLEAWLYGWLGTADDRLAGLVSLLFYAALLGILYSAVYRRSARPALALLATAAVASIPRLALLAGIVFADVPFAALLLVMAVYALEWLETGSTGALILSACAAGLASWCKQEGVIYLSAALGAVYLLESVKNRRPYPAWSARVWIGSCLGAAALIAGPWWLLVRQKGYVTSLFLPLTPQMILDHLERLPRIAGMQVQVLAGGDFGFIWPVVLLFGAYVLKRSNQRDVIRERRNILILSALFYLALSAGAYVLSDYTPLESHFAASYYRLATHVIPIAVTWVAFSASGVRAAETAIGGDPLIFI